MHKLQTVRIRDIDVRFRTEGPKDAPVVMLAHGILTTHAMWDRVVELLASNWRLLSYDLRGHGGTTATKSPYTVAGLAQDAINLLDELEIEQVHFIGSSLGGMLGQLVGAEHPSRLLSLTLANTTAVQGSPQAWQQRIVTACETGLQPLIEPTLQRWFTLGFLEAKHPEIGKMQALAQATSLDGFLGCASAVRDLSQLKMLSDIRVPTLVVAGLHDTATTPQEARHLADNIAGAELVFLPAAHQAAVECPEAFTDAWKTFVSKQPVPIA